ncbi:MAG TPA: ABC transporter permease [Casimicrobiaceae bacterium]|nr:ABC transporter permease [Casimicrobiaceae bacterium]
MNTQSMTVPESPPAGRASTPVAATRLAYWSIRRELWENRSIYLAPLIVAGVVLIAFLFSLAYLPGTISKLPGLDSSHQHIMLAAPYDASAIMIILVSVLVAWFYCLEALHSERRDRSILFWKSLPVSDLTTVLSKATIPLVLMPLLALAIVMVMHLIMLALSSVVLLSSGSSPVPLWNEVPAFENSLILLYGLVTLALWYAPIYGWLLLVSAWAERATLLWAVLPPLVISVAERILFHTSYIGSMITGRLFHGFAHAFVIKVQASGMAPNGTGAHPRMSHEQLAQIMNPIPDPMKFLTSPSVWIGLVVAAALIGAAIWLRRRRDPM